MGLIQEKKRKINVLRKIVIENLCKLRSNGHYRTFFCFFFCSQMGHSIFKKTGNLCINKRNKGKGVVLMEDKSCKNGQNEDQRSIKVQGLIIRDISLEFR